MSSRLCLNVRGYIRDESRAGTLPGPASAVHSPPRSPNTTMRNAYVSFTDAGANALDREDPYKYHGAPEDGDDGVYMAREVEVEVKVEVMVDGAERRERRGLRSPTSRVVRAGTPLGALEMHELRAMRAESPSHLRMLSVGRKSDSEDDSIIHIR